MGIHIEYELKTLSFAVILRTAYDIPQHAEKQYSYAHFCHSNRRLRKPRVSTTCCRLMEWLK
jgi:hypothetical protein